MSGPADSRRDVVFQHRVTDVSEQFDPTYEFDLDAAPPAQIRMNVEESGDFWLSANSEGYLHLARVFAEIGLRSLEDGYHFHMNSEFKSSRSSPEFSFEVDNTLEAAIAEGTGS